MAGVTSISSQILNSLPKFFNYKSTESRTHYFAVFTLTGVVVLGGIAVYVIRKTWFSPPKGPSSLSSNFTTHSTSNKKGEAQEQLNPPITQGNQKNEEIKKESSFSSSSSTQPVLTTNLSPTSNTSSNSSSSSVSNTSNPPISTNKHEEELKEVKKLNLLTPQKNASNEKAEAESPTLPSPPSSPSTSATSPTIPSSTATNPSTPSSSPRAPLSTPPSSPLKTPPTSPSRLKVKVPLDSGWGNSFSVNGSPLRNSGISNLWEGEIELSERKLYVSKVMEDGKIQPVGETTVPEGATEFTFNPEKKD